MKDDQTIYRKRRTHGYVIVDKQVFEDARLSWDTRGLMGYILAKPDDWTVRVGDLIKNGNARRDALRRMFKELQACGYVNRYRSHNEKGAIVWITEVYESPSENPNFNKDVSPLTDYPSVVQPSVGEPSTGNQPIYQVTKELSNHSTKKTEKRERKRSTPERDPNLDHPAVEMYRDIRHITPNKTQRKLIAERVKSKARWEEVLTQIDLEGRDPRRVDWALERYEGRNVTGFTSKANGPSSEVMSEGYEFVETPFSVNDFMVLFDMTREQAEKRYELEQSKYGTAQAA